MEWFPYEAQNLRRGFRERHTLSISFAWERTCGSHLPEGASGEALIRSRPRQDTFHNREIARPAGSAKAAYLRHFCTSLGPPPIFRVKCRVVDPGRLFDELLGIASRTGLEVRTRAFRGKVSGKIPFAGGLCTVLGRKLVLLNANATAVERSVALADALAQLEFAERDRDTMSNDARRFLAERARSQSGVVAPEWGPKPGLAKTATPHKKKPQHR